jgi:hypothetical protein
VNLRGVSLGRAGYAGGVCAVDSSTNRIAPRNGARKVSVQTECVSLTKYLIGKEWKSVERAAWRFS